MKTLNLTTITLVFLMLLKSFFVSAQIRTLDDFETTQGWSFNKSDGVNVGLTSDKGLTGKSVRFDYDFTKGTGFGGIQKSFSLDLPENYEFSFYIKAISPANNFEIKFIDASGNNVWWVNNRNFDFPEEWKKIRIRKRHISFAWGPATDHTLKQVDRIEFTIASFVGGKGTIWLDDLKFEPLPAEIQSFPSQVVTASGSLKNHPPAYVVDNSGVTYWQSRGKGNQYLLIDFKMKREFGGLQIDWMKDKTAESFDILLSDDRKNWEEVYSVRSNRGDVSFIRLPEAQARFLRLNLITSSSGTSSGVREIKFLDIKDSMTPNDFLIYAAKNSPEGEYPRYFSGQASYWTISGVNNDTKEALISEDGMIETDKAKFSLEPMIELNNKLFNWSNVKPKQSLGYAGATGDFVFMPTVSWLLDDIRFTTNISSGGEPNVNSVLYIRYGFENNSDNSREFRFYILVRPFQVNPWYQFLNLTGGAGKIQSIREDNGKIRVDDKMLLSQKKYDAFGASVFDEGNLVGMLEKGSMPDKKAADDPQGLANGVIRYSIRLEPHAKTELYLSVPFYSQKNATVISTDEDVAGLFRKSVDFWAEKVNHVRFRLPASADRILNTWKSQLVYILINRDNFGIQPGSRSYERSWIRDGALTSSALLKSGIVPEVKDFINWYVDHQYENGKVPCVVDFRGPDPVPENDSHGEMIYLIREYFNFTKDTAFLRSKNKNVLKAVEYIESLVAQRSIAHYRYGNDSIRAQYGLVPESISHEGYSAKPMHSYWDNFFTMKGLKDAADIQHILGENDSYERVAKTRDTFRVNLYNSLRLAIKNKKIDFIPGCAELGDFDATSTTIALTPCNELLNLPKPQVYNTFERYFDFYRNRRDGKLDWINYTPYENRLIGSFIMLDQPEKAHELIDFFLHDQRPPGWNHWAEVVWKEYRTPRYIGDMPHTWCGSDFINAVRSMFVYENEYDQSLIVGAALRQEWIDASNGMSIENLPTYYGEISFSVKKENNSYRFTIRGELKLPANGIKIRNFNGSRLPQKVSINGKEITGFTEKMIPVNMCPAEITIYY